MSGRSGVGSDRWRRPVVGPMSGSGDPVPNYRGCCLPADDHHTGKTRTVITESREEEESGERLQPK